MGSDGVSRLVLGTQIGSSTDFAYLTAENTWQTLSGAVTSPAGTASMVISFEASAATSYIDDVTIIGDIAIGIIDPQEQFFADM